MTRDELESRSSSKAEIQAAQAPDRDLTSEWAYKEERLGEGRSPSRSRHLVVYCTFTTT